MDPTLQKWGIYVRIHIQKATATKWLTKKKLAIEATLSGQRQGWFLMLYSTTDISETWTSAMPE